ncbi:hypothetical protein ACFPL7_24110 [Dongia soli]|uniref:Uncharacterized protein n=1 Tax=Dongia soli TaxID=600628 RepID=A0ABU5EG44_9PROT|nr:hypothetical protein [Dongia soli]MDY0885389.1 hypothetical protein [Dongia soli]
MRKDRPDRVLSLIKAQSDWWEIGREFRDFRAEAGSRAVYAQLLEAASEAAKKSTTQLRRYQSSYEFAERLVAAGRVNSLAEALKIPEVTLDCLARLDRLSKASVNRFLRQEPLPSFTYRDVQEELKRQSLKQKAKLGPRELARRMPVWFHDECLTYLRQHSKQISKEYENVVYRDKWPFEVPVDAIIIGRQGDWCDGSEFVFGTDSQPDLLKLVYKLSWSARFFRSLWIWIPVNYKYYEQMSDMLKCSNLQNVGVISFDADQTKHRVIRRPSGQLNNVDPRRSFIDALLSMMGPTYASANLESKI